MTEVDDQIRSDAMPNCHVCGARGEPMYRRLQDRLFGASGEWDLNRCTDPQCGLLWLNPMPRQEDLGKAYQQYYTHEDAGIPPATGVRQAFRRLKAGYLSGKYGYQVETTPLLYRWLGRLFYLHPGYRARLDAGVFYLAAQPGARMLEVGCGSGAALKGMQEFGWVVEGVDFDINSVHNARAKGLVVHHGDLLEQRYPDNSFEAIVMSHVLEHVPDPTGLLRECYRVLKPGGRLVSLTPNSGGLGHRFFGRDWRGLEPPRHLHIFNLKSLFRLAQHADFDAVTCQTSVRSWKIFQESYFCSRKRSNRDEKRHALPVRMWFEGMEFLTGCAKVIFPGIGEELKLIGTKNVQQ